MNKNLDTIRMTGYIFPPDVFAHITCHSCGATALVPAVVGCIDDPFTHHDRCGCVGEKHEIIKINVW